MAQSARRSWSRLARPNLVLLCALVLLFAATSTAAYTIFLKDGSKIIAKDKYRIEGDQAFITLPSGTETFLPADQIDVERTRTANAKELGTAIVIEGGQRRRIDPNKPTAKRRERRPSDIVRQGDGSTRLPIPSSRTTAEPKEPAKTSTQGLMATNAVDLTRMDRAPLANADLSTEIETLFAGQGVDAVRVYRGTTSQRPFIHVIASSEAAVFRTLTACANTLSQLRERHGAQIEGLELLMLTSTRGHAGQFFITPDLARQLNDKEIEPSEFFVRNVQF